MSKEGNTKGSVVIMNKLKFIQHKVATTITGAIRTTAGDTLDMQANILPINILFNKVLFRATTCLCLLLPSYPLHSIMCTAKVKWHRSPIHNLFFLSHLNPGDIEIVNAVRCHPEYQPSFDQLYETMHSQWWQYHTLITCTKYIQMAQATREESVLQQFYTKEIMPSRPLDIISACHMVYEGRGSRSINGSTFTKQFKQEAQWCGDNGIRQSSTYKGHRKSVSACRSLHPWLNT